MEQLRKSSRPGPEGPVILAIMDGVGVGKHEEGDAVRAARTPNMRWLKNNGLYTELKAHGTAVGMPSDGDMGNSEVGHNAIGCGRVYAQGAKLVSEAIASGAIFRGDTWKKLASNARENAATLHFIGLFSDGNVHSHIAHLKAMLKQAAAENVGKARIHILLDGRDVGETSALEYVEPFEKFLAELNSASGFDYSIASGGGRMKITMDRYGADWNMVKLGWDTHVRGVGPAFESARQAIESHRREYPGVIDQDLPPFVIVRNGEPVGRIQNNDSVIYFNFRGDRAIEISRAFEDDDFDKFDRSPRPKVQYAGMMQYDGDLLIPKQFLVAPPAIARTMGEYLAKAGVRQLALSETQKFGHVTYFFNGNRSGKFNEALEDYIEIPSDRVSFEQRPWMKSAEITDCAVKHILENKHPFIRFNYPNGDMVGHTGVFDATVLGVESVDLSLGRVIAAAAKAQGLLIVSADHGNADDMYEHDAKTGAVKRDKSGNPKAKTSHSLNPVPCYIKDFSPHSRIKLSTAAGLSISSLAATCLAALGFDPPADYDPGIVEFGDA